MPVVKLNSKKGADKKLLRNDLFKLLALTKQVDTWMDDEKK